jgi:iron complex transport system substrate-binding protein
VTTDEIPRPVLIVGIVSAALHRHNVGSGRTMLALAALLASLVLAFACTPDAGEAIAETETNPESALERGTVQASRPDPQSLETPSNPTTQGTPGFPAAVSDASGRTLVFPTPPGRIVSLVPSATRTLEALGARSLLVGRTEYDTTASLAGVPSVGGGLQPSLETLLALRPDLVIRHAGESDRATPLHLDEMGVRHLAVRTDRIEDVRTLMRDLGILTGRDRQADSLLADMDARFQEVRHRIAGRPPVRVAYLLGGNPPWVAGPGTFIDELLAIAGGENPFADLKAPYGPVSPEELLVRGIDLVLAPEGAEVFLPSSSLRLVRVSPEMELPGPDLARFAWKLAVLLHPQVFR